MLPYCSQKYLPEFVTYKSVEQQYSRLFTVLPVRKVNFFSAFDVSYKSPFMITAIGCSSLSGSLVSDSAFSNCSHVFKHSFLNFLRKFNTHIHLKSESPDSGRCSEVFFVPAKFLKPPFLLKKFFRISRFHLLWNLSARMGFIFCM